MNSDVIRQPDSIFVQTEVDTTAATRAGEEWTRGDVVIAPAVVNGRLLVRLSADNTALMRVHLRWSGAYVAQGARILGDAWERGYGDLEWRGLVPERILPWYVVISVGDLTKGFGVETGASAMCWWRVDSTGVSLWLDVRSGGAGVRLRGRSIDAAIVVAVAGELGESAFEVTSRLCRALCPNPIVSAEPIYGGNNWYYAYGHSSHAEILADTDRIVAMSPTGENRPFMVIDDGWEPRSLAANAMGCGAPWDQGNDRFPDMPGLAAEIKGRGARPGIWLRPLAGLIDEAENLLLPKARAVDNSAKGNILDPSIPENLARVEQDFARLREWGYELIKHDWTTCDIFGRWGFDMGSELTNANWSFADNGRTSAEIIAALYAAIRSGAGNAVIIGCNTVGHIGAGYFDLQRTGDDTSGREWERTRKMGVNTLAFRMPQHGSFFAVDADCVGLTTDVPWSFNRQWLDLLARSGTPLFVSAAPAALGGEQREAVRRAFEAASQFQSVAEPIDWLDTTCPAMWKLGKEVVTYDWFGDAGIA